jgi:flavin reductase (DIM6/NTAB) family NADH-FMN oxidoreductase RutF
MNNSADTTIDAQRFRDLMAGVCAPVTVVTTLDDGEPYGATVSSFASLSLNPPLITIALDNRSALLAHLLRVRKFGVNLLSHDQADLATLFAQRDADRFADTAWYLDHGIPRLKGAPGWMVCGVHHVVTGGDHQLILGRVEVASRAELPPLIYAHRTFGTHSRYDQRPRPQIVDQIATYLR